MERDQLALAAKPKNERFLTEKYNPTTFED